jgi:hypothetical protein
MPYDNGHVHDDKPQKFADQQDEICGDGTDNDGDGQIDEGCTSLCAGVSNINGTDSINNPINDDFKCQILDQVHASSTQKTQMQSSPYRIIPPIHHVNATANNSNGMNHTSKPDTDASAETARTKAVDGLANSSTSTHLEANENSTLTLICHVCMHKHELDSKDISWKQVSGPKVELSNSTSPTTTFKTPSINSTIDVLDFILTITDHDKSLYRENNEVLVRARPITQ